MSPLLLKGFRDQPVQSVSAEARQPFGHLHRSQRGQQVGVLRVRVGHLFPRPRTARG